MLWTLGQSSAQVCIDVGFRKPPCLKGLWFTILGMLVDFWIF